MNPQLSLWQAQHTLRGISFALATFLSTALIGVVVKWLPVETPMTTIGFFQFFTVLVLTLCWGLRKNSTLAQPGGLANLHTQRLPLHLLRGLSGLFAHLCFYMAIASLPLVDANLLLSASPLWVPVLMWVFLRQAVASSLWVSILTGLIGVIFILHPHLQTVNLGAMYGLLSGILLAIALLAVRALARSEPPARQLFYYALWSTLMCLPFVIRHWRPLPWHVMMLLASAGLLLFAQQWCLVHALRLINAALLAPMSYFTIVFAGLLGWLLWSEVPDMRAWIGVTLVLCSGVLTVLIGTRQQTADTAG